MTNLIDVVIN